MNTQQSSTPPVEAGVLSEQLERLVPRDSSDSNETKDTQTKREERWIIDPPHETNFQRCIWIGTFASAQDFAKRCAYPEGTRIIAAEAGHLLDETTSLLKERGSAHGNWAHNARVQRRLKEVIESELPRLRPLPPGKREALDMICVKIGRIIAGDPSHADHWDDIAGYARLGRDAK